MNPKPFISAAAAYFGRKPAQTLAEFKAECDQLTKADREELAPLLSKELGYEVSA